MCGEAIVYRTIYKSVAYVHAGSIDQPLEFVRMDAPTPFAGILHANWRGTYDVVTFTGSQYAQCGPHIGYQLGNAPECFPFDLASVNAFGDLKPKNPDNTDPGPRSWTGSLITGSRDASGLLYRRNRYLDPKSGRFTQEDPIGLAGGLNVYGFANGDPVTYSDPYGLSAQECPPRCSPADWENVARRTGEKVAPAQPFISGAFQAILALFPGGGAASVASRGGRGLTMGTRGRAALAAAKAFRAFGDGLIERPNIIVEATTVGRTLRVSEIAYYPGRAVTRSEMRAAFRSLENEARERGYEAIELTFQRTKNADGHIVNRTMDLTK